MEWSKVAKTLAQKLNPKLILAVILLAASLLRLWKLDSTIPSLFGDELDVGYHAYSILKTGQDYSGNPWPLNFQSLAEWRTPLYLYSSVPTVALFGISSLGVRLPAAVFGILSVFALYLLVKQLFKQEKLALLSAMVFAFSPWAIQYSRAGFEVTQLIFFLLLGLYFFFKSLEEKGKWLWLSVASLCLTPWIYSTAKLFTPFLILGLFLLYSKSILKIKRSYLIIAIIAGAIIGGPVAYSTLFGGGTERFNYISVFSDPTIEAEVGAARQNDARIRGESGSGLRPSLGDKLLHNKFTFWGKNILNNYYQAFSTDFLFNEGDPNLRHSIAGIGQFYKLEFPPLIIGLVTFFAFYKDKKIKLLLVFWLLAGVIPASITRDGGHHATRLILILPPLIFLLAYGLYTAPQLVNKIYRLPLITIYCLLFLISFIFYQHNFWVHNPWGSERWWHSGYREAIQSMKQIDSGYEKVFISTSGEPPWIFFAAWYQYPPDKWHEGYPMKKTKVEGLGEVSYIDKYYFGSVSGGLYDWGKELNNKTLYIATAKDVNVNLIMEPERTPGDLRLIKAIAYPSGEPAFYLFSGK